MARDTRDTPRQTATAARRVATRSRRRHDRPRRRRDRRRPAFDTPQHPVTDRDPPATSWRHLSDIPRHLGDTRDTWTHVHVHVLGHPSEGGGPLRRDRDGVAGQRRKLGSKAWTGCPDWRERGCGAHAVQHVEKAASHLSRWAPLVLVGTGSWCLVSCWSSPMLELRVASFGGKRLPCLSMA